MDAVSTSSGAKHGQGAGKRQQKQRLEETLFIKHHASYSLPSVKSSKIMMQLSEYEAHITPPSELRTPIFRPQRNLLWCQTVSCPCNGCGFVLSPHSWLAHFLIAHQSGLRIPFVNLAKQQVMRASCPLIDLPIDVNILLGVFSYQRIGLNPLNCTRNTFLPDEYRQLSQHDVLLLFACRTQYAPLWQRKQLNDVLAIWAETPLQGVAINLRAVAEDAQRQHHYAKRIKARPFQADPMQCRDFIKTDRNMLLINLAELKSLLKQGQPLNVELHLMDTQKIWA